MMACGCLGALTLWVRVPWVSASDPLPSGATCEVVLAPCDPSPCRNSGECKASEDYESFSCVCPGGWQGEAGLLRRAPGGTGIGREAPRGSGAPGWQRGSSPSLEMSQGILSHLQGSGGPGSRN